MHTIKVFSLIQKLENINELICPLINKRYRGGYTLYNTVKAKEEALEKIEKSATYDRRKAILHKEQASSLPLSLKYLRDVEEIKNVEKEVNTSDLITNEHIHFPLENVHHLENDIEIDESTKSIQELMELRNKFTKEHKNWMVNYDNYEDTSLEENSNVVDDGKINYGTPDPKSRISSVPCGGCGAHLHCKDPSLPGYIPSEIFKNSKKDGAADLTALICQRCYFLKNHNVALQVQVSDEDYPKVLQTISTKKCMVVLMVDLTDFPCSIWPGINDIFHKMPILVVGNKVDLLPKDSPKYLQQIKKKLTDCIKSYGIGRQSLLDVILISATTGYGVEDLIIKLQRSWHCKGDVYLVGCTNVGKSSLFNTLIQSDYCKSQAEDLIQRATTSIWPGTTLNLLKFPISRPGGFKLELRLKRLQQLKKLEEFEIKEREKLLKETNDWRNAVLMGRIDRSSSKHMGTVNKDGFSMRYSNDATGITKLGLNEKDPLYANSRWCYDTPGVVPPDQILNLLTAEELFLTLPKTLIRPRTYCIRPGDSLFIGGLARLDFLEGEESMWFTVFASEELPISICVTENAEEFYQKFLGTKYLKVPFGGSERLKKWPGLSKAKTFDVNGVDYDYSSKDVVLSNAGWIAVTCRRGKKMKLCAWTPEKRGVYVRDCLLPQAVNYKGTRIRSTPAYEKHIYFSEDPIQY